MKGVWKWTLSLTLGLLTGAAWADEVQWRAAAAQGRPAPAPTAPNSPDPAAVPRPFPVTLALPVKTLPPPNRAVADGPVRPVAFTSRTPARKTNGGSLILRSQKGDGARLTPIPPSEAEMLRMPSAATGGAQSVPPGAVVLPYGTILPPGASLPPNVIIAPAPSPGPGPLTATPQAAPEGMPGPGGELPECGPDSECGPVETLAPSYMVPGEVCDQEEVCGEPDACCVSAESCCDCDCECCFCEPCPECLFGKSRVYFSADYLLWWTKGNPTPPLVTTTTNPLGTPGGPVAGSLADPNATVLFGGSDAFRQFRSGMRFGAGIWLTESQLLGLDGSFLFLPRVGNSFIAESDPNGSPPLYRPFTNIANGGEVPDAQLVSVPGFLAGGVRVDADNCLWSPEVNLQSRILCGDWYRLVVLGGFRYVGMTDTLTISERGLVIRDFPNNGPQVGDSFALTDSFKTRNQFYGGQLGARAEIAWGKFVIDMRGKCALGSTTQVVDVNGSTVINNDPPLPGGLLTQASNIGRYRQSRFAVVPEGAVNVGYQVTDWWRVYVGYTFLYWSSVVRPGQQIDANVNGSQLPRLAGGVDYNRNQSPKVPLKTTDFWAQGINFGMELRF